MSELRDECKKYEIMYDDFSLSEVAQYFKVMHSIVPVCRAGGRSGFRKTLLRTVNHLGSVAPSLALCRPSFRRLSSIEVPLARYAYAI